MEEAEQQSKVHTQKALEQLREHLQKNPEVLNKTVHKLRDNGKKEEVDLLNSFADGSYAGYPKYIDDDDNSNHEWNWTSKLVRFLSGLTFLVALLGVAAFVWTYLQL